MSPSSSAATALVALAAVGALGACDGGGTGAGQENDAVAERFAQRSDFASCVTFELSQGDTTIPDEGVECVESRVGSSEGGELTVSIPTTEGDPILYHFRAGPGVEGVERYVDYSRDEFGNVPWEYCATVEAVELFASCAGRG